MIILIFLTACLIFSVFIIVKQEQTIRHFKADIKQHKFNSEQNFLFFQKAEEKNRILKDTIINHELLIINLSKELKNIKQLLSNN
jgi:hypothetical protein